MERLTKRYTYSGKLEVSVDSKKNKIICSNFCTSCGKADCEDIRKALFKLAEYEDLEEQGKLLELPCAVGDTVYEIFPGDLKNNISEERVMAFSTNAMMISRLRSLIPFNEIGKKIFLTKEEAELALKTKRTEALIAADKITFWEVVRTIAGTEKDKVLKCSNCGHMINLYDLEHLRFEYPNDHNEHYNKAMKEKYYRCENCGSKMDSKLSYILREQGIVKTDYYEDGYKKEIVRILLSREYSS